MAVCLHADGSYELVGRECSPTAAIIDSQSVKTAEKEGPKFQQGLREIYGQISIEIAWRSGVGKLVVLPKRWIIERTIAWPGRCRRLAKKREQSSRNGLAFLQRASTRLMLRKPNPIIV